METKPFTKNDIKPIIKWVGGKRQLVEQLIQLMPVNYNRYYEPFFGGGALFFALRPYTAFINDVNSDLMTIYKVIKEYPIELITLLEKHKEYNSKDYYYDLRVMDRNGKIDELNDIEKSARLLYMLRVDFNGLYRVNSKGQFNVPYGRYKNPNIVNKSTILAISELLNTSDITIRSIDFAKAINGIKANDFVYFDPPYIPVTPTSSFTSYTASGFNYDEQIRLQKLFFNLKERGVYVMLSNSDTDLTRKLYSNANIHTVKANRMINSNAKKRGQVNELIITSY